MNNPSYEPWGNETLDQLITLIRNSPSKAVLQRAQSILLWLSFHLSVKEIATIVGWSSGTVRNFRCSFKKHGLSALDVSCRGGRRHATLSRAREQQLLHVYSSRARSTGHFDVHGLKGAYEQLAGRKCAISTIYRLIHRHGLSHKLPRARRPVTKEREKLTE